MSIKPFQARFHIPFEHGAWWSFFSTLAGSLLLYILSGKPFSAGLLLAASLSAGFVAQDWGQALVAAILRRPSRAKSQWQAWQGWALILFAMACTAGLLWQLPVDQWPLWCLVLGSLGLAAALALALRVRQQHRGREALGLMALLLGTPAIPYGLLIFGLSNTALAFAAWPLVFYPAATLAAQSFVMGLPLSRRWLGVGLEIILGAVAAALGAWVAAAVLLLQALRLVARIRWRVREISQGLPPMPVIRRFGMEQAAFGVSLSILWVLAFI